MYEFSARATALRQRVCDFMEEHIYPNERRFYGEAESLGPWSVYPVVEELKPKARAAGLWNLFLPESAHGAGLTNFDYASLCEVHGPVASCPRAVQLLRT
jgi:acyl-CoA dehydrogenase